jgi:hypothetical protein
VGVPVVDEATVAVTLSAENCSRLAGDELTLVVVLALVTVMISGAALLFDAA